jgi:hypothetical protein
MFRCIRKDIFITEEVSSAFPYKGEGAQQGGRGYGCRGFDSFLYETIDMLLFLAPCSQYRPRLLQSSSLPLASRIHCRTVYLAVTLCACWPLPCTKRAPRRPLSENGPYLSSSPALLALALSCCCILIPALSLALVLSFALVNIPIYAPTPSPSHTCWHGRIGDSGVCGASLR